MERRIVVFERMVEEWVNVGGSWRMVACWRIPPAEPSDEEIPQSARKMWA
jgi:hypothetical protein